MASILIVRVSDTTQTLPDLVYTDPCAARFKARELARNSTLSIGSTVTLLRKIGNRESPVHVLTVNR